MVAAPATNPDSSGAAIAAEVTKTRAKANATAPGRRSGGEEGRGRQAGAETRAEQRKVGRGGGAQLTPPLGLPAALEQARDPFRPQSSGAIHHGRRHGGRPAQHAGDLVVTAAAAE